MQSGGLTNKLRDDVTRGKPEDPPPRYRVNQPLTMTQLAGAQAIIFIGLLISIMIFLCEFCRRAK